MRLLEQFDYRELPPILSTEGMRQLDAATKEEMAKAAGNGVSAVDAGYELMKLAGAALFKKVVEFLDGRGTVAVFVGGGNNGGDGLVLAKLLIEAGIPCNVYSLAATEKFQNEAKMVWTILLAPAGVSFRIRRQEPRRKHRDSPTLT